MAKKTSTRSTKGKVKQAREEKRGVGKKKYKVRNWSDYNEELKQRGSIEVWVEKGLAEVWYEDKPTGKPGSPKSYSDKAIVATLQFGVVFHQKLRQTEGLVGSIFQAMGMDLDIPDYSTLFRRSNGLVVELPKTSRERVVAIMDSTGLKVYGEGEWKVRQHGFSKHRTWRKFHISVTSDGEIRAIELTGNDIADGAAVSDLLKQETATVVGIVGDGGYDKRPVYTLCQEKHISDVRIPPQKNAKIWQHGNSNKPPHPRDENLRKIRTTSRKRWKEQVSYHIRSISENIFFRFKTIFGDRLNARLFPQQSTEAAIKARVLNIVWKLGMPESYVVG
jgi:hypothetical protein